eukprot:CAMPEP_0119468268 /NCGR_PEP_ID=MMETSP1344-20130328/2092_1 /TAXON_ID=236787 /ORGANISM="Florenciella parvula, Strain CCMP2471" /LENGTH=451 /DNA_ID=CAMNT_0007500717 /DNA_START=143 /DNA_END=1498 /DNA_ORIENTATION=+
MAPTYNDQKQPQSLHHSPTPSSPPLSLFSSIDDAALVIVVEQRVSETSPEQRVCLAHLRTDACIRGAVRCKYAHTDWTLQEYGCLPSWRSGNHSPALNKLSYRDLARASQPPVSAEMAIAARGAGSGQRSGSGSGSGWGSAKVEHRTGQKGGISLDVLARIRFIILDGTIIWDSDYREKYTDWLATLDKALDDDGGSDGDGDGGGGGGGGDGLGTDGEEQPLALHELFGQRVLMYSLAELVSLPTLLSLATACRFTLEQFDASDVWRQLWHERWPTTPIDMFVGDDMLDARYIAPPPNHQEPPPPYNKTSAPPPPPPPPPPPATAFTIINGSGGAIDRCVLAGAGSAVATVSHWGVTLADEYERYRPASKSGRPHTQWGGGGGGASAISASYLHDSLPNRAVHFSVRKRANGSNGINGSNGDGSGNTITTTVVASDGEVQVSHAWPQWGAG